MSSTIPHTSAHERLQAVNPVTGEVISEHPIHTPDEVNAAVRHARKAAAHWGATDFATRRRALLRWASYLENHADELTELIHVENGKPIDDAFLELMLTLEHIRWAAKNARKSLRPRSVHPGLLMANYAAAVEYRPLGVVGVIGPWNYPIYTPNGSIAYALAAGNAVIFKPSEYATAVGNYFVSAFAKANPDLPHAVLSSVNGYGSTGAALVTAGVDKIAFTGSTATGKRIMASAAQRLTPVLLECGGKDAAIVAADADLVAAADAIAWGAVANSGQTCVGVERVYVVNSVRDQFIAELVKRLNGIHGGAQVDADYGPMTMPSQIDVVRRHIVDALDSGATAVLGGRESVRPPFIDPVVLVDTPETSMAVREETFGPTVTVRGVVDLDEAIELANAGDFGLASSVFSRRHGPAVAGRLRVGATSINSVVGFAAIGALSFGGVGESGFGRIHGTEGLHEFVRPHSIARQRFTIPGMALLTLARSQKTMKLVRQVIHIRHGRIASGPSRASHAQPKN